MIDEASDATLRSQLKNTFTSMAKEALVSAKKLKGLDLHSFKFKDADVSTCVVQLRALGLIRESARKRSVKDTGAYWSLTPLGDQKMVQLRALRRSPAKPTEATIQGQNVEVEGNPSAA